MAAVDLNTVRAAIETHFIAGFGAGIALQSGDILVSQDGLTIKTQSLASSPDLPVVFYNMAYEPTPNSSWVQCLVSFGANEYLSQGLTTGSQNRVVGLLLASIFTPQGVGPGANYVIGKRIRDLYNRVIVSGVFFDAANGPAVLASPVPEGYFQTQVRVTFEFIEEL